ncbi:glycosyltransferase family 77 protein [Chrysochromulina tobinii]|uniref:Glycosyltransferase family 77 protein n=1 Tax=Chrysochromulina tobinii TaxID=1460289 RepID=A0A0M0K0T9_9EUKA|nr:glycosyltransferase family 77 protein [Chrysochromulina tobinii]|eukprot:KOO32476.1 glycosyltransferase family 77 protein [Chrysochromulina sp. CCMP291]
MLPEVSGRALALNEPAKHALAAVEPRGTTIHFTFGTSVMMDFVKNWLHFAQKAGLTPLLVGAADLTLLKACSEMRVPAAGIIPELDRKPKQAEVYEMKSNWGYIRHHKSDFLEMGLVKVAFLWELLAVGFSVLISDLDVVWLNGHWQRWMTHSDPTHPAVPEAALIAAADVLVTTDGLDVRQDARGGLAGIIELNTGVVYFRQTVGAKAMVQSWRKAMLHQKGRPDLTENVNDQSLFNQVRRVEPDETSVGL